MGRHISDHSGFIALISVLTMSALILAVGIGLASRGISLSGVSSGRELSARAHALAESCAEHAVLRLVNDLAYAGGETIVVSGSDACDVLPVEGSGNQNRVIKTEALMKGYKRRIRIELAQVKPLTILTWKEAPSF